MRIATLGTLFALGLMTGSAAAQDMNGWTGEGTITAGYTTGNSETTDIGAGLKGARQFDAWRIKGTAAYDYGENSGIKSRDRWAISAQLDRDLSDRFFVYGRGSYEEDAFSGFDSHTFLGVGAGYKLLVGEMTTWTIEGGPGYRRDVLTSTGLSEEKLGARAGSAFAHKFNDSVALTNDTEWAYSDVSTHLSNITALTAKLTDILAARVSFEVRNESDPPAGRKATDTATKFSLVFGF